MKTINGVLRALVFPVMALVPAFSLSAGPELTLSAGGGLTLGGLFTGYTITADEATPYGSAWIKSTQKMEQFCYGGFLFFDAAYVEFSVDIQGGINSYRENMDAQYNERNGSSAVLTGPAAHREGTGSETTLGFTLLGKYPFRLRERLLLYPLAGIEYRIALAEKRTPQGGSTRNRTEGSLETEFDSQQDYTLSMWNAFFINLGMGMDLCFQSPLYFRMEFLYAFRLKTAYENAALDWLMDLTGISRPKLFGDPGLSGLTHGPELRLAMGCRLK
ncbi:MAG: hypothetical protein LBD31_03380 [Treponema sp.]|nr:hypothetical protein [Treponema sp.]